MYYILMHMAIICFVPLDVKNILHVFKYRCILLSGVYTLLTVVQVK